METLSTIKHLLRDGESRRLEFMSSQVDLNALGATICSFLNCGGGQIIVGVRDDASVEGKVSSKQIEEALLPLAGGHDAMSLLTPSAIWDATDEPTDDGSVVLIDVPAGADVPYVFREAIYVRIGSETREATGSEIRELIERRYRQAARWERQPVLEVELSDLDMNEIYQTAQIAAGRRGWRFRDSDDPKMILEDLNLIDGGRLTNAAVILFGIEAGHIFRQAHVRLTAYASDKAASELREDLVSHGHLFEHLKAYEAFLHRHVSVVSDFSVTKEHREDRPQYPFWSLREGFRNALIHRDYDSAHGEVSVSVYPSYLEIWSFGDLPPGLTIASLKGADRSLPVNPDIAQVVFLRGLVDLLGRGTRKIVEEFKGLGLPEPIWRKQAGGVNLSLRSRAMAGEIPKELNARQVALLRQMKPGEQTDLSNYGERSEGQWSERTLRSDLSKLVRLGYLAKQGQGKSTFYVRTEKPTS